MALLFLIKLFFKKFFKRKGLQTILELSMSGNLGEVVVSHKDRLSRFAFELIEWIIKRNRGTLVVLDRSEHQSGQQELAEDLLSIVTVFNCRNMGRRRYHADSKPKDQTADSQPATKAAT
jgi:predicted site-specific integrase-resolvase